MFRINYRLVIIVSLMCLSIFSLPSVSGQSNYGLAYLQVVPFSGASIFVANTNETISIPAPDGLFPSGQASVSPGGQWIAITFSSSDAGAQVIQLFNITTNEIRQISTGLLTGLASVGTLGERVVWSPNASYIAFVSSESNNGNGFQDSDVYVYSMETQTLTNLTNDDVSQYRVAWSTDSNSIVTSTDYCSSSLCTLELSLFNRGGGLRVSRDISDLSQGSALIGANVCQFAVSPDSMNVAFRTGCGGIPEVSRETYVWSVASNEIIQITNFVSQLPGIPNRSSYNFTWSDDQTLIVGADYEIFNDSATSQHPLLSYSVASRASESLSSMIGADFSLNPIDQRLAYREVTDQSKVEIAPLELLENTGNASSLQFEQSTLTTPSGCGLSWSPDGSTLAYTTFTEGACQGTPNSAVFVASDNTVTQYPIVTSDNQIIVPIGWLAR